MRFGTVSGRLVLVGPGLVGPVLIGPGPTGPGSIGPGLIGGDRDDSWALDVSTASAGRLPSDPLAALERWDEVCAWAPSADWSAATQHTPDQLGAPVPAPRQVFAVALNYAPHAAEAGYQLPAEPLIFTKFPSCITGPVTTVELPEGAVDWEIEVVAVIGRGGHRIPREKAWDAVAGVTLGQDLSERRTQLSGKPAQFSLGKSFPGFGPIGPVAVTPDEFDDRDDLGFESWIGDELIQHGRTSQMIFAVDDLVARISAVCPLLPGDLIFSGTPEGVGNRRTPQRFLQPGETLVSRLAGVGELRQTFI